MVNRPTNDMIQVFMSYFLTPKSSLEFGGIGAEMAITTRGQQTLQALVTAQAVMPDPDYANHPAGRRRYMGGPNHAAFVRACRTEMQAAGFDNPFKWAESMEAWKVFEKDQWHV